MLVIFHILVAVLGLVASCWSWAKPSSRLLKVSTSLLLAALISGITLMMIDGGAILPACIGGLIYTSICAAMIISGKQRLVPANRV